MHIMPGGANQKAPIIKKSNEFHFQTRKRNQSSEICFRLVRPLIGGGPEG